MSRSPLAVDNPQVEGLDRAKPRTGPRLSVVIPVYNEVGTIAEVVRRVQDVSIEKEIIIVDDGSTDGTRRVLELLSPDNANQEVPSRAGWTSDNLRILLQSKNCGKGAALRRGFQEARGGIVIIQDADLELDPQEYSKLIEPIERGTADVVYGSRFLEPPRDGIPFLYLLGNKLLTQTSNICTGMRLTDVWTGYKVFRREVLRSLELREDRFGFEPEVTARIAKAGYRVCELPVSYACRSRDEGKKIGWKDAVRGMWCTLRYGLFL
ncbi:MAG: glycosyltransferase family 2 protein [Acidobacteriia bacterium]|nr:glycosyltransferase family 2 protein [Terriglobia bacterium]